MKIREHFTEIAERLTAIEVGLTEHMRRTAAIEKRIAPLIKIYHFLQVSGALIVIFAALAGVARLFI